MKSTISCESSQQLNTEILEEKKILNLKCFKWLHNHNKHKYDEMFDYQTEEFILSEYNIKSSCKISDDFRRISYHERFEDDFEEFDGPHEDHSHSKDAEISTNIYRRFTKEDICIEQKDKNFLIKYNPHAYIVCKYYNDTDPRLELSTGRIIRIGKFILKVAILKINNVVNFKERKYSVLSFKEIISEDFINKESSNFFQHQEEASCRFCFKSEIRVDDPLISVCNCRGTLRFVHTSCLEYWIKSKCTVKCEYLNPNCYKITLDNFFCEICKKNYPLAVNEYYNSNDKKTNRNIFLLNILKTQSNYIILKSKLIDDEFSFYNFNDEKNNLKEQKLEFYLIQFENSNVYKRNTSITFGRDKKCDIVLNDVSVSRKHFAIYFTDNGDKESSSICAKIKDFNSKFGTLLNMQDDMTIRDKITIQKGNTVYHYKLRSLY